MIIERVVKNGVLKIFLSSPFDGCLEERDRFMKTELPVLEKELEPFGVHVSVVDMRWGITNKMGDEDLTLVACLSALDGCDIFIGYFSPRFIHSFFHPLIHSYMHACMNSLIYFYESTLE